MSETRTLPEPDVSKSPQQLYAERSQRILAAIALKQPDRIPTFVTFGHLLADLEGITRQELYENPVAMQRALENACVRFQPDAVVGMFGGHAMSRALGDRMTKWPGYGLEPNESYQYLEAEFMKVEDYEAFLADPADWAIRTYLPRVFSELEPLRMLPPLGIANLGYYALGQYLPLLATPPFVRALQALTKGAEAQLEFVQQSSACSERLVQLGFPIAPFFTGGHLSAPFDFIGDTLRGMRGVFSDMRRCPDKLLAAEEKVLPIMLEAALSACRARHSQYMFVPLHRGSVGFISLPNFERFYWPQLKRMLLTIIEAGITPAVIWEGAWDQRLKYLQELPKGKTIGLFQNSDIFKVKQVLGDSMCIVGGMPVSLLAAGSREEVWQYSKRLCQELGPGGGFIMSADIGELEGCKPDLIHTWLEATREFGVY